MCSSILQRCTIAVVAVFSHSVCVFAAEPKRLALLIGNAAYSKAVGPLVNPYNDVALLGASLKKLGFDVTVVRDGDYRAMDAAFKRHAHRVRLAGKGTLSFVYYSGHGVANPDTRVNYIIPVDVAVADENLWFNAFEQESIVNRMKRHAPQAIHYVVFDACRNELNISGPISKSLRSNKGFVPIANSAGILIAYSTAPGRTASDAGSGGGRYAKVLAEEIVRPGIEAVSMFRQVQLRVARAINQDPWLNYGKLPEVYLAGRLRPDEIAWRKIERSNKPSDLEHYLRQFPHGPYSQLARFRLGVMRERIANAAVAKAWDEIETSQDIDILKKFIKQYPTHAYSDVARLRVSEILRIQQRERLKREWRGVKASNDVVKLKAFVSKYPDSLHASVASDRIAMLENRPKPAPDGELAAKRSWELIKDSDDPAVVKKFLERYPRSSFAVEAMRRLEEARTSRKSSVADEEPKQSSVPRETADGKVDLVEMTKTLQRELTRVNCAPGGIDGIWGVESRNALQRYNTATGKKLDTIAPTIAAIEEIKASHAAVCKDVGNAPNDQVARLRSVDGRWRIRWWAGPTCRGGRSTASYLITIFNGSISSSVRAKGKVAATGSARWSLPHRGARVMYSGKFTSSIGRGTFWRSDNDCSGTFVARRS